MPRPRPLVLLLLVPVGVLSGCGGRDETFRTSRAVVRFQLGEYRIAPQDVTIKAGLTRFAATNVGRLTHNLVIEVPPGDPEDEPEEIGRLDTMQPGQSAEPVRLSLRPGDYDLVCTIANHDDLGQYGELHVEE